MLGAITFIAGAGSYLALAVPPYQLDESSHVGYSLSLRSGDLPTVTTPVPRTGGHELDLALNRPWPFSDPEIHVANNPPFAYVAALPLMEVSHRAGWPGGPLIGFRMFDVLGAVGAIGFAYLLGRELAGGDDLVGLVTAGTLSAVIAIPIVTSAANVDGPALLATTGVTWSLARLVRTRSSSHALNLGLWCAGAAAIRPMALAFAAVAGLIGVVLCARTRGARALVTDGLRIGLPTVVLVGWFYALNIHRYGDATGSAALFEKYGTNDGPSFSALLTQPDSLLQPLHYLLVEIYGATGWWDDAGLEQWTVVLVAIAMLAAAVALAWQTRERSGSETSEQGRRLDRLQWSAVAVLAAVPVLLLTQHMSGGGAGHPRYLMPMLPIIAAATALVLTRVHPLLAVTPVAAFAISQLTRLRTAGGLRVNPDNWFGVELGTQLAGQRYLDAALAVTVLGALLLVGCTVIVSAKRRTQPELSPATT